MSSVDEIWVKLQEEENSKKSEYKNRLESIKKTAKDYQSITELISSSQKKIDKKSKGVIGVGKEKKWQTQEGKAQINLLLSSSSQNNIPTPKRKQVHVVVEEKEKIATINSTEMLAKISRDINASHESSELSIRQRISSLENIHNCLFVTSEMPGNDYNIVFAEVCKTIFRKFADSSEKCREWALKITLKFFERSIDLVPILGYFFPAFIQRLPSGLGYDEELKVFVVDVESHEAYKRGKAVDRQDKSGSVNGSLHAVIEQSEELRLLTCRVLGTLIKRVGELNAFTILHPYFHEIILFLQFQLRDPYPDLKLEACSIIEYLAYVSEFEAGMKFFAVALVRAVLPVVRHRHAKVRLAAVPCLKACMMVPDRAKLKGSGTEAMPDLVGFRDDNVIQVSSFYKADVQINYLAELACDPSIQVREKFADMLNGFLTEMGDRYDHQSRVLPYLLDLLTDPTESVSKIAMSCLQKCGSQYEDDHHTEILEKRQYGVDGDDRINLDKPLPYPFQERPRVGIRLYVRGNTKRFLFALVNELTNWISQTRVKSAQLLKVIVVLCEEHLTMEAHTLLPGFIKALGFAKDDKDVSLYNILLEVFELVGRYMHPEVYLHYILPRLRGDNDVVQFGVDAKTRVVVMEFLRVLVEGSKASQIVPYFEEIASCLSDPFVISQDSQALQAAALDTILSILKVIKGRGKAAIEAHFLSTGRLTTLKKGIQKGFEFLLFNIDDIVLHSKAVEGLQLLSTLVNDDIASGNTNLHMCSLFKQCGLAYLEHLIEMEAYEIDESWSSSTAPHRMLKNIIECPWNILQCDIDMFVKVLNLIIQCTKQHLENHEVADIPASKKLLEVYTETSYLISALLSPTVFSVYNSSPHRAFVYSELTVKNSSLKSSQRFGLAVTNSEATRDLALATLFANNHLLLRNILDTFISHKVWSSHVSLETHRLSLLSCLLGFRLPDQDRDATESEEDESSPAKCLLLEGGFELVEYSMPYLISIANGYRQPYIALLLRKSLVNIAGRICDVLSHGTCRYDRVRPFSYWKLQKNVSLEIGFEDRRARTVELVQPMISTLLSLLNDSNDEVRQSAIETLTTSCSLVREDSDSVDINSSDFDYSQFSMEVIKSKLCTDSMGSLLMSITFTGVVCYLLHEVVKIHLVESQSEVLVALDNLLRCIAVLDSVKFEIIVRRHFALVVANRKAEVEAEGEIYGKVSDGVKDTDILALLSGLIDHASILTELRH